MFRLISNILIKDISMYYFLNVFTQIYAGYIEELIIYLNEYNEYCIVTIQWLI